VVEDVAEELEWGDASTTSYTAESASVNGKNVVVCLDDEGPLRPAFYWTVEDDKVVADGWASSIEMARSFAVHEARRG
jgi:hypothetical protein